MVVNPSMKMKNPWMQISCSVQSLGKKTHLRKFDPKAFDYIVIEEFHHASAGSYQNILNYFTHVLSAWSYCSS